MNIEQIGEGRWKVQSRTQKDASYLVKFWAEKNYYSCDCSWGLYSAERTGSPCAHVKEVIERIVSNNAKNPTQAN
ncbi:MAG: hypothetical protein ACREBS_10225 [Nitrososphaerales archaeon]